MNVTPLSETVVVGDAATCIFDGCQKPQWARSLCGTHYSRWRRRGDVVAKLRQRRGVCSIDDCDEKHQARGLCDKHYRRLLESGDPTVTKQPGPRPGTNTGPLNPMWRGDDCGYQALHLRIATSRGSASEHQCTCGAPAAQWAYDHSDPSPLVTDAGWLYSLDIFRYDALCHSCHVKRDHAEAVRRQRG